MSVESAPKIVIQNKLRRSREKIKELNPLVESKRTLAVNGLAVALCSEDKSGLIIDGIPGAELNELSAQISSYSADNTVGAIDDLTDVNALRQHLINYLPYYSEIFGSHPSTRALQRIRTHIVR